MEAIIIHPENVEQLKTVKAILKALNVPFENQSQLPPHVSASLKKGLKQSEKGQLITFDEFKKNHF